MGETLGAQFDLSREVDEAWLGAKLRLTTFTDTLGIARKSSKYRALFDEVKTYCLFVGYPRSGHSLISSLIDAHPNAILAHRLNSLKYVRAGFTKTELFYLLLRNSQRFAKTGRKLTGYRYTVPHQWQGRFQTLHVIGDQEGKGTTQWLAADSALLSRLLAMANIHIKFVHVIRNPYDNISTWANRTHRSLAYTIRRYFSLCRIIAQLKDNVDENDVIDVRYETFLDSPETGLSQLCHVLGLKPTCDYLSDCAGIVYQSPRQTRRDAPWTPELIDTVKHRMAAFHFLEGYTYYE
jgi:hypothetical protein